MATDHWNRLFGAWKKLPVQRQVNPAVIAAVSDLVKPEQGRILMLGTTPGLSHLGSDLTAIDRSEALIRTQWRGDTSARRAIVGDWMALPFLQGSFGACIGDGVLNTLSYPDELSLLFNKLSYVVRSGGHFICRIFAAPDKGETISGIADAIWQGEAEQFQALKFRLGMAIAFAQGNPNVALRSIHRAFNTSFPDRDHLAAVTGCTREEINTIDIYAESSVSYNFPTRQQCLATIPDEGYVNARYVAVPNYSLAERYPLLVVERR